MEKKKNNSVCREIQKFHHFIASGLDVKENQGMGGWDVSYTQNSECRIEHMFTHGHLYTHSPST